VYKYVPKITKAAWLAVDTARQSYCNNKQAYGTFFWPSLSCLYLDIV